MTFEAFYKLNTHLSRDDAEKVWNAAIRSAVNLCKSEIGHQQSLDGKRCAEHCSTIIEQLEILELD